MELSCKVQVSRRAGFQELRGQDYIALRNNSRTPQHLKMSITKGESYDDGYGIPRDKGLGMYFRTQGLTVNVANAYVCAVLAHFMEPAAETEGTQCKGQTNGNSHKSDTRIPSLLI